MSEGQQGWGLMTVGGTVRKGAAHRPGGEGCTWGAGRGQGLQAWAAGSIASASLFPEMGRQDQETSEIPGVAPMGPTAW